MSNPNLEEVPQSVLESGKWVINGTWRVDEKIASGGFGAVYKGHSIKNSEEIVAIKTEKRKNKNYIAQEAEIYRILGHAKGFPCMRWTGKVKYPTLNPDKKTKQCKSLVIDFMGPSLSDLFYKNDKRFSLNTVLNLAQQMLDRLEYLHSKGVVHRDVKPGNFVMGRGRDDSLVYLIDFGLSHQYLDSNNKHIEYTDNVPFRGTHRYASVNAHMKVEQTRRDDLESLGYVLIYFLKGTLPWQNLDVDRNKRRQAIGEFKKKTDISETTCGLPVEFEEYLRCVKNLTFKQKPNYEHLRSLFRRCFVQKKFSDTLYDWSPKLQISSSSNQTSSRDQSSDTYCSEYEKNIDLSVEILPNSQEQSESHSSVWEKREKKRKISTQNNSRKKPKISNNKQNSPGINFPRKRRSTKSIPPSALVIEISDD